MSRVTGVGETPYHLLGTGARWTRRGAELLGRLLRPVLPKPDFTSDRTSVRVRRVAELGPVSRFAMRLWIAWLFSWRTRWATFDWYVTAHADDRIVGMAGVVDRQGAIGDVPVRLALLGAVFTLPEHRGRGFASDVVRRATQLMSEELGSDFGILLCTDQMVRFYEGLGWQRVPNRMCFVRFGRVGYAQSNVMVYACAGRPLPDGTIDVKGLPA
jgi:GNAT superfamily N-acetyltransferase